MSGQWATSGIDLHLEAGRNPRSGLEGALRDAVRTGRLRPQTQLPSSRALARDLGLARNTVADAYAQLGAEGWLTGRRGSGTYVSDSVAAIDASPSAPAAEVVRLPFDLRAGSPDLTAFPREAWLAAARRALHAAPADALGYGDPRGRPELRSALADYLGRARGVRADPERIVVCSGFTQGLGLLCDVLRARGARTLAVESHGQAQHREIASVRGLHLTTVPVDRHGAVLGELGAADALLLTPAHQFPLGSALAAARRTEAVRWAHRTETLVIEDDYDGEFRHDGSPVGAVQALAPEHVAYAGTASKSLAPGLRLAWLVLPAHLVDEVTAAKYLADGHTSSLEQLTLAEFIVAGDHDRQVRRTRLAYRRRRNQLGAAVTRRAPQVRVTGIAAGLHALLELPGDDGQEDAVVARAAEHGLALEGLRPYRADERSQRGPALVVGYGTPPAHAYAGAIDRLGAVLGG